MNFCLRRPFGSDFGLRCAAHALFLGCIVILTACSGPKTIGSLANPAAPTISAQPENQSVTVGATATFSVTATGTAPLAYQWSKDGAPIGGATDASYTTPATVAGDDGSTFTVEVTNGIGNVTSVAATLTVTAAMMAPSITTQPVSQSVIVGGAATFSVTATGTAPLNYQWSKNGTSISGATSSSYTTPAVVIGDNGATFTVQVNNGAGSALSTAATLNVTSVAVAPSITAQPADQTVAVGAKAIFTVQASGTAPLVFQWSKNGAAIAGATASSYTTPAVVIGDNGSAFSVQVTNSAGNVTSSAATLTVNNVAPTITGQPKSQTVSLGATATFSVTATGTVPITYQWFKNGTSISAATASSYTTPATVAGDNGATFTVSLTNSAGTVLSAAATLSVNVTAPTITSQPQSQSVLVGATAAFSVTASGTAPLSYQWSKNGTAISGATAANYTTPAAAIGDNGATFTVTVTNSAGSATSGAATLTVTASAVAPGIITQPLSQSVTVGTAATFSVTASGTAPLTYQWSKNGAAIAGATGSTYTTPATVMSDSGASFTVTVTNSVGSVPSAAAILTVNGIAPTITAQPQNQSVVVGATGTFSVSAAGTPTPTYQWSKNGAVISGATGATYTTPATVIGDNGATFTVVVTNSVGSVTSNAATLTVKGTAPTITAQPQNQNVAVGATATFLVTATGTATLTYQWSKNGTTISGATAPSYTTPATVIGDNNASFTVQVTNPYGIATSNPAKLTVAASGTVSVLPQLAPLTTSQTQQFTASVTSTWSVDGISGGNTSVGTITTGGLYTPGSAAGAHTILATSAADSTQSGTAIAAVTDLAGIYSYHNDDARTGQNLKEYALTPAVVSGANFGPVWSCAVDGAVYAQPLYVANLSIGGGIHNVVYIATEHDSVYAFDADSNNCTPYWQIQLYKDGVTSVPVADLNNCPDTPGEIGITGTPVIDPSTQTLYFVSKTKESGGYFQRLHRVNISTGAEQPSSPVVIKASDSNPFVALTNHQKAGLALANGTVYIGWASHCDNLNGSYVGWMMSYDATSLVQTAVLDVSPNTVGGQGGVWMSGGAPAIDSAGSVYVSTGNGEFQNEFSGATLTAPLASPTNLGMSFIKFNAGSLAPADFYTPGSEFSWSMSDYDISSSGVTVLTDGDGPAGHPKLLFGSDKQDHLWLLDRSGKGGPTMGGFSTVSDNAVQDIQGPTSCLQSCVFSTPAYFHSNTTIYLGIGNMGIAAIPLINGAIGVSGPLISQQSQDSFGFPGTTPQITASPNGAGAVVWGLDTSQNSTRNSTLGPAVLRAYDATNLATRLYSSTTGPNAVKFAVPLVANGRVYVGGVGIKAGGAGTFMVYGPLN